MDELITAIITNIPNFLGLAMLALVLYRQNEKLTDALIERIVSLENRVNTLAQRIQTISYERGKDLSQPPYTPKDPQNMPDDDM